MSFKRKRTLGSKRVEFGPGLLGPWTPLEQNPETPPKTPAQDNADLPILRACWSGANVVATTQSATLG